MPRTIRITPEMVPSIPPAASLARASEAASPAGALAKGLSGLASTFQGLGQQLQSYERHEALENLAEAKEERAEARRRAAASAKALNALLKGQQRLQAEDARLDMQENFNKLKLAFAMESAGLESSVAMPRGTASASAARGDVTTAPAFRILGATPGAYPTGPDTFASAAPATAAPPPPSAPDTGMLDTTRLSGGGGGPFHIPDDDGDEEGEASESRDGGNVLDAEDFSLGGSSPAQMATGLLAAVGGPPADTRRVIQPKDYAQQAWDRIDQLVTESVRGLKYPEMERKYRIAVNAWAGQQKLLALQKGIKLHHQALVRTDQLAAKEEATVAVFGASETERQAAVQSRMNRIESFVASGLYSEAQGQQALQRFEKTVETRQIERDFGSFSATIRNQAIGDLRAGRLRFRTPEDQQRMADWLETADSTAMEFRQASLERARQAAADGVEKTLVDLIGAGQTELARQALKRGRGLLTGAEYLAWSNRVGKGPTAQTDPAVERELIPQIYNSRNNPALVDERLRLYYQQGLVATDDMKTWGSHLETRLNRMQNKATADQGRAESRLHREQSDVEQRIASLTQVNGAASPALDALAQDAKNWALADMQRNSPIYGGKERPMDWLNRNEAQILGRVAQAGRTRLKTLDDARPQWMKGAATDGATMEAVRAAKQLLQQNRTRFRNEAEYVDQARFLMEKEAIIREMQRFQPARPSGTTSAPASPNGGARPPSMAR